MKTAPRSATLMALALSLGAALASLAPRAAHAGLGDWDSAVEDDRVAMGGQVRSSVSHGKYTVIEIRSPSRIVYEYTTPEGRIFAISWRGINHPDLSRLMSGYYAEYKEVMKNASRENVRRARNVVRTPRAIVVRSGHMRDLRGKIYDKSLFPAGVSPDEIR